MKDLFGDKIMEKRPNPTDEAPSFKFKKGEVLTCGYQKRTLDGFIAMLKGFDVNILVDLRSRPFGRKVEFNKIRLSAACQAAQIKYLWMGDKLGGLGGLTKQQWTENLKAVTSICSNNKVAIMCMEHNYEQCHRKTLAEILTMEYNINVHHI